MASKDDLFPKNMDDEGFMVVKKQFTSRMSATLPTIADETIYQDSEDSDKDQKLYSSFRSSNGTKPGSQTSSLEDSRKSTKSIPKVRREESMNIFTAKIKEHSSKDWNSDLSEFVALDTRKMNWMNSEHCMLCYLGMAHDCNDDEFYQKMDSILRKPFFISNIQDGAQFEKLGKRGDNKYAVITYMVKYAMDSPCLPVHEHPYGEEYFVLDGSFDDNLVNAPAPCYVKYPCDTHHAAWPKRGATVLTWWGQNDNATRGKRQKWWKETEEVNGTKPEIQKYHADKLTGCDQKTNYPDAVQSVDCRFRDPRFGNSESPWEEVHRFGKTPLRSSNLLSHFELTLFEADVAEHPETTKLLHVPPDCHHDERDYDAYVWGEMGFEEFVDKATVKIPLTKHGVEIFVLPKNCLVPEGKVEGKGNNDSQWSISRTTASPVGATKELVGNVLKSIPSLLTSCCAVEKRVEGHKYRPEVEEEGEKQKVVLITHDDGEPVELELAEQFWVRHPPVESPDSDSCLHLYCPRGASLVVKSNHLRHLVEHSCG